MAIARTTQQDDILIRVQQRLAQRGITGPEADAIVAKIEAKLGRVSGSGVGMQRAVGQPSIPTPRGEPVDPRYAKFQVDPNDPLVARGLKPRQIAATPEDIAANGMRFAAPTTQPVEKRGMFSSGARAFYGGLEDAGDFGITADMLAADNRVTFEVGNRFAQIQAQKRSRPMSEGAAAYAQAAQGGAKTLLSFAADRPGAFLQGAIDQNLQSLGSTAASIVGAPLAGALAPALMGSGSGLAEASNELAAALEAEGVDVTDGGAVTRAMNTPDVRARVRDRVLTKSTTVGAADFATMGIASRIPGGKTFVGKVASQLAQTGVEAAGGMAGEALSQVASGQELQTGDILSEGIGELLPGSAQVAALGARRLLNPNARSPAPPTPGGPAPGGVGGNARPPSPPSTPPVDPMDAVADSLDERFMMKPSVLNPMAPPPATEPAASPVEPPASSPGMVPGEGDDFAVKGRRTRREAPTIPDDGDSFAIKGRKPASEYDGVSFKGRPRVSPKQTPAQAPAQSLDEYDAAIENIKQQREAKRRAKAPAAEIQALDGAAQNLITQKDLVSRGWILDRRFGLMDPGQQESMILAGERLDPVWGTPQKLRDADPADLARLGIARPKPKPFTPPAPPQGRANTLAELLGMDSEEDARRYANSLSPLERERLGLPLRALEGVTRGQSPAAQGQPGVRAGRSSPPSSSSQGDTATPPTSLDTEGARQNQPQSSNLDTDLPTAQASSPSPQSTREPWQMTRGEYEGQSKVWNHQTWREFSAFDMKEARRLHPRRADSIDSLGFWFTDAKNTRMYGPVNVASRVQVTNPYSVRDTDTKAAWSILDEEMKRAGGPQAFREQLIRDGYDGVVLENTRTDMPKSSGESHNILIAFDPAQIEMISRDVDASAFEGQATKPSEFSKHKDAVLAALAASKPVPPEVLAEYGLSSPESPDNSNPPESPDSSPQPQGRVAATTNKEPNNGEEVKAPQAQVLKDDEDAFERLGREADERKKRMGKFLDANRGKPFEVHSTEYGATIAVTPSAKYPGEWQVTWFSPRDGKPSGDTRYATWDAAVAAENRFGQLKPETAKVIGTAAPAASSDPRGTGAVGADNDADAMLEKIKEQLGRGAGRQSPDIISAFQELGSTLVPGVRLQDAEEVGRMYAMLDEGTVTLAEYANHIDDLRKSGKVVSPSVNAEDDALVERTRAKNKENADLLARGIDPTEVAAMDRKIDAAKRIMERTKPIFEAHQQTPGPMVTGRSGYTMGKKLDAENNRRADAYREYNEADKDRHWWETRKAAYLAGEVHANGQPRADAPSRKKSAIAKDQISAWLKTVLKPGQVAYVAGNSPVTIRRVNDKTITTESDTKWDLGSVIPKHPTEDRPMTPSEVVAAIKDAKLAPAPSTTAADFNATTLPHHVAVYGDKAVSMEYVEGDQFKLAGQRVADNAGEGYVVTPMLKVFAIRKGKKYAQRVTDQAEADRAIERARGAFGKVAEQAVTQTAPDPAPTEQPTAKPPSVAFRSPPPWKVRKELRDAGFERDSTGAWVGPDTDEGRAVAKRISDERDAYLANKGKGTKPAEKPAEAKAETVAAPAPAMPDKRAEQVKKLRAVAASKAAAAQAKMDQDRNTNTYRRSQMAAGIIGEARRELQKAEQLRKVADAIEAGNENLARIRTWSDLEELRSLIWSAKRDAYYAIPKDQRPEEPGTSTDDGPIARMDIDKAAGRIRFALPAVHSTWINELRRKAEAVRGLKAVAAKLPRFYNGDEPVQLNGSLIDTLRTILAKVEDRNVSEGIKRFGRLAAMSGETDTINQEKLAALMRDFAEVTGQVKKATEDPIKKAERELIGQTVGIDFFPTPKPIADDIISRAGIEPGMKVLEPSAGNGRLADAAKEAGAEVDAVELSSSLRDILTLKGHNLVGQDFDEFNPGPVYDRIVMNPPFSDRRDVEHVRRAFDMLKPGGRLVAIMSEGPFFGSDKKATAFRDWLETMGGTSEKLPPNTFMQDKSGLPTTGVNARIVVVDKPSTIPQENADGTDRGTTGGVGAARGDGQGPGQGQQGTNAQATRENAAPAGGVREEPPAAQAQVGGASDSQIRAAKAAAKQTAKAERRKQGARKAADTKAFNARNPQRFSRADVAARIIEKAQQIPDSEQQYGVLGDADDPNAPGDYVSFAFPRKIPTEVLHAIDAEPQLRTLLSVNPRGLGPDWLGYLGVDKYVAQLRSMFYEGDGASTYGLTTAVRRLEGWADNRQDPEAVFLLWLHDAVNNTEYQRPDWENVATSEFKDGDRFTIAGVPFEVMQDENGYTSVTQRGEDFGPIDDAATFIHEAMEDMPIDKDSRSTAEVGEVPDFAPEASTEPGMFGQPYAIPNTGSQTSMFGDIRPDEPDASRYPGIRPGESIAAYNKRMGTTDTPDMFGGPSSAGGDPRTPQRAPSNMADRAIGALERIAGEAEARMQARAKKRGTRLYSTPIPDPRDMIDAAAWAAGKALVAGIKGSRAVGKFITDQVAARWPNAKFDPAVLRRTARRFMDGAKTPQDVYDRWQAARNKDDAARTREAAGAAADPKVVKEAAAVGTAQRPDVAARIVAEVRKSFRAGKEAGRVQALAALKPVITKAKQAAIRAEQMRKIEQRGSKDAAAAATQAAKVQAETEAGIRDEAVRLVQSIPGVGRRYLKAVSTAKGMRDLQKILHRLRKDLAKSVARDSRRRAQAMARMFKTLTDERREIARKALYDIEEAWKAIKSKDTGTIRAEELAQSMREAAERIKAVIVEQRDEDKVRILGKMILMSEHRDQMVEQITKQPMLPQPEKVGADRTPNPIRLFVRKYANFRTLMQIFDGQYDENGIFSRMVRAMAARRTRELAKNQEFIDRAEAIVKANGYKSWSDFTMRTGGALGDASVEWVNIVLGDRKRIPVGLAMALYAQDPETKSLMHEGQTFKFHKHDLEGFTVDDYKLAELEAALTPAQKTIAVAINRLRSDMQFDRADEVYKDITGNRMVKVPDHYPRHRLLDQTGSDKTMDLGRMSMGEWAVQSLENAGFTIERKASKAPLLLSDFAETQVRAFQGAEMMIQRAQLVKYLKNTIAHPDVLNQIDARYGTAMARRVLGVLAEFSGNAAPESDKVMRRVASRLAQTMTQTNPLTWLRNLSTVFRLPLALVDGAPMGVGAVLAALPEAAANANKTMRLLLRLSPDLRHRWSHAGAAISLMPTGAAPDADSHFADAGKATIRQLIHAAKGLRNGRAGERFGQADQAYSRWLDTIKLGNVFDAFAAVVAYHVFRAKAPTNLSPAAQDRWAAARATDAFMQTANTNDLLNATEFQTDARRNTMTALLLTFTSDIAKMQNLAYLASKRGGRTMAVAAGSIAASVAWSTAIKYVASAVLGDDEDKRDEEAAVSVVEELLSLLPGGVNLLAPLARFKMKGNAYGGSGLLDTPFTMLVGHIEQIGREMSKDDANAAEVAYRVFRLLLDPIGNPLGPISGMARKAIKNYSE